MAPHLPLPISSGGAGTTAAQPQTPLESLRSAMAGGETGRTRAASGGVLEEPRAPPRSARHSGIFESPATRGAADTIVTTTTTNVVVRRGRDNELKTMLEDRRRQLVHEVQAKIRDARTDSTLERDVLDQGESSEVESRTRSDLR